MGISATYARLQEKIEELGRIASESLEEVDRHKMRPGEAKEQILRPVEVVSKLTEDNYSELQQQIEDKDRLIRQLAEENATLRQQNDQIEAIFNARADGITINDMNGRIIRMNKRAEEMLGYTLEDADKRIEDRAKKLCMERTPGVPFLQEELPGVRALNGEAVSDVEILVHTGNDRLTWLSASAAPVIDACHEQIGVIVSYHDITRNKQLEEERRKLLHAIEEDRELLRTILDQIPAAVFVAEVPSGRLILGSREIGTVLGPTSVPVENMRAYEVYTAFHSDGSPYQAYEYPMARAAHNGEVIRNEAARIRRSDGSTGMVLVNAAPVRDEDDVITAAAVTLVDVTEQRKMEEELRFITEGFRLAIKDSPIVVYSLDSELRYIWINNPLVDAGPFVGRTDADIYGAGNARYLTELYHEAISTGKVIQREVHLTFDHSRRYYVIKVEPQFDDSGKNVGVTCAAYDITTQKQTEHELAETNSLLEKRVAELNTVIDAITDGLIIYDKFDRVSRLNRAAEHIMEYSQEELRSVPFHDFMENRIGVERNAGVSCPVEDLPCYQAMRGIKAAPIDVVLGTARGNRLWVQLSAAPIRSAAGEKLGTVATLTNINSRKELERKLEERTRELEATFNSIADAVVIYDVNANIMMTNRRGRQLFGYTPDDFRKPMEERLAKRFTRVETPNGEVPSNDNELVQRMLKGEINNGETLIFHTPTGRLFLSVSTAPIETGEGEKIGVAATFTDITGLKQTEAVLRQFAGELQQRASELDATLESIADGVVIYNMEGCITRMNRRATEITRYTPEDACRPIAERIQAFASVEKIDGTRYKPDELAPERAVKRSEILTGQEVVFRFRDGSRIHISISAAPIMVEGRQLGAVVVLSDISRLKQVEADLRELTQTLEKRVNKRTSELEALNLELEGIAYSLSHDLRTPLRAIDGYNYLLNEEYGDQLDETARDYIARSRAGAQKAWKQMDAVLDLLRMTRVELEKKDVNLSEVIQSLVSDYLASHPDEKAHIDIEPDVMACGNADLLTVVLQNLLDNAFKYTSKKDDRRIWFGVREVDGKPAYYVKDNGTGFDMRFASKLFKIFQRLHVHEFEGIGIGLASVRHIVLKHGGRVWAEGEEGKGATFYFSLG